MLWNALQDGVHQPILLRNNKVAFVTFNYDRSLEFALHEATKNSFGVRDEEAFGNLSPINILHVYGKLGEFSWESSPRARAYGPANNATELTLAFDGLRVIPDTREDDSEFKKARTLAEWAEQICFLGFGFDPLNMERLGLDSVFEYLDRCDKERPTVVASCFGKTDSEIKRLKEQYISLSGANFYPHKNLMTLRESGLLG